MSERKRFRKNEAPLHPCTSFKAVAHLFGLPDGHEIKPGAQLTMHCHNSQVQINLCSALILPKRKKSLPDQPAVDASSLLESLPEDLLDTILAQINPAHLYSKIPRVNKNLYLQTRRDSLWKNVLENENLAYNVSWENEYNLDRRNQWFYYSMGKIKNVPLVKNATCLFEVQPFARALGVDTYQNCKKLGSFLLRMYNTIVGAGRIVECNFSSEASEHYYVKSQ